MTAPLTLARLDELADLALPHTSMLMPSEEVASLVAVVRGLLALGPEIDEALNRYAVATSWNGPQLQMADLLRQVRSLIEGGA